MNASDIQKFIDEQVEYCNNFVNNPEIFINKTIQFINKGKTSSDLAKELNIQENTVNFLIKIIEENHKDLLKGIKNLSAEIVLTDFNNLNYKAFITKNLKEEGTGIEIYPKDTSNWSWAGASFTAIYPINNPDFAPNQLMSAYSNCWDFNFRPPHKVYCSPKTEQDKQEVLQMLQLINKWLWEI